MRTLEELRCALVVDEGAYIDEARAVVRDLIAHVARQAEQIATLTRDVDSLDKEGHLPCSLTARVEALESAGKVQTPAKLDEAPLGVGAKVLIPGEVVRVDDGDCTSLVKLRSIGDQHVLWFLQQDLRPEPANTSLTCVLCRSVEPQEGRVHTIRRHGKGHTSCDCAPAAPPPPAAPAPASDDYEARARAWADRVRVGRRDPLVASVAALLRTVDDEATAKAAEKARREERAACEAVCREVAGGWAGAPRVAAIECIDRIAARECADRIAARGKGDRTDG